MIKAVKRFVQPSMQEMLTRTLANHERALFEAEMEAAYMTKMAEFYRESTRRLRMQLNGTGT